MGEMNFGKKTQLKKEKERNNLRKYSSRQALTLVDSRWEFDWVVHCESLQKGTFMFLLMQ